MMGLLGERGTGGNRDIGLGQEKVRSRGYHLTMSRKKHTDG